MVDLVLCVGIAALSFLCSFLFNKWMEAEEKLKEEEFKSAAQLDMSCRYGIAIVDIYNDAPCEERLDYLMKKCEGLPVADMFAEARIEHQIKELLNGE